MLKSINGELLIAGPRHPGASKPEDVSTIQIEIDRVEVGTGFATCLDFEGFEIGNENCPDCGSNKIELVLSQCGLMYDLVKGKIIRINIMKDCFADKGTKGSCFAQCRECESYYFPDVKLRE